MGKKNIFIGLSTLLLVLLLGLSTRTYADTYRTWSKSDIQNVIYNYGILKEKSDTEMKTYIANLDTKIEELLEDINSYQNAIFLCQTSSSFSNFAFLLQDNTTSKWYYYSSRIYSTNTSNCKYYLFTPAGTCSTGTNWLDNFFNDNIFYTSKAIYTGSNSNTIKYSAGQTSPSTLLIGPYVTVETGIRFVPYPTKISDVYIGQNYNLTAYGCNKNNTYKQMLFGDLIQPPGFFINEINVTMSYYNRGKSKWIEKYLLIETGEDLVPSNYKSSIANFKWENYDSSTYTITFRALIDNEYVHEDCLYSFTFIGEYSDGTPFYIEQTFYIIGSNTVITDGTLDISFLTNGDYSNEYANDLNELASKIDDQNDLINAVEQGNINSWLPGSGDWSALVGLVGSGEDIINTANLWGFRNYSNSYWAALYEMMNATYTVLSQTGTVALDVSFHGYNHAITSADIPSPPLPIKNTISLCLITFVMISIYKSFSKKIEKLKMVDTSVLKSEAHDDSDLM